MIHGIAWHKEVSLGKDHLLQLQCAISAISAMQAGWCLLVIPEKKLKN